MSHEPGDQLDRRLASRSLPVRLERGLEEALVDPVVPRFELASLWYDSTAAEKTLSLDCQGGIMATLGQSGTLLVREVQEDTLLLRCRVKNPHRVFVDPSGSYVLTTSLDGEVYFYVVDDKRVTANFSLQATVNASLAGTLLGAARTRPGVHVGQSVCWTGAKTGSSSSVSFVVGTQKRGMLFSVTVALPTLATVHSAKAIINRVVQLPNFFATSLESLPVASVFFGVLQSSSVLFVSTPVQLYRVCAPLSSSRTCDALLQRVETGELQFQIFQVTVPTSGVMQLSDGALSVFRTTVGSPARSYAWNSSAGVLHGLFADTPAAPLPLEEAGLFSEVRDSAAPLDRACGNEVMTSFAALQRTGRSSSVADASSIADDAVFPTASTPQCVGLTAFHMVLLFPQRCIVLNHPAGLPWRDSSSSPPPLASVELPTRDGLVHAERCPPTLDEVLSRVRFDPFRDVTHVEPLLGLVRDVAERKFYLFSDTSVWELRVEQEHRQQWRLFVDRALNADAPLSLRKRMYDAAYNLCRSNGAQRNLVQYLRGCFYLSAGAPRTAVSVLAECDLPVEAVARLLSCTNGAQSDTESGSGIGEGRRLLTQYLAARFTFLVNFRQARSEPEERQQTEELVSVFALALSLASPTDTNSTTSPGSLAMTQASLNDFIDSAVKACDASLTASQRATLYGLLLDSLQEYETRETALYFAERVGQYEHVVVYCMSIGDGKKAIETLSRHTAGHPEMATLWYTHGPGLFRAFPTAFVTGVLKVCSRDLQAGRKQTLEMENLLPCTADYTVSMNEDADNTEHQVIVLFEQAVHTFDCVSSTVHNYYVALLAAQHDVDRLEEMLESSLFYDVHAALRACLEHRCSAACVFLYKRLGLFDDAVLTALQDGAPAIPNATEPARARGDSAVSLAWPGLTAAEELLRGVRDKLDEESYKRLWVIVTEYAIERTRNARVALAIVDQSDGTLQLSDVLASIQDGTVVQDFKDAICASLDRYANAIDQLHRRQEDIFRTAEGVKRELRDLRQQFGYVTAKQRCPLCHRSLLQSAQPVLVYTNCRHVVHEACAVELLESIGGLDAFFTDEGVSQHLLDGVNSVVALAHVDCVICGEATIVQTDIPLCEEDPSWALK